MFILLSSLKYAGLYESKAGIRKWEEKKRRGGLKRRCRRDGRSPAYPFLKIGAYILKY